MNVQRKAKGATNGGNAANNLGAVDMTSVPGVGGDVGGFNRDSGSAAGSECDCHGFVEVGEKSFDENSFMIAFRCRVVRKVHLVAHSLKKAEKGATGVGNDETAHADL